MNDPIRGQSVEDRTVLTQNAARQGVTGHNARYVLGFSVAAIVVVFAAIYVAYFGL